MYIYVYIIYYIILYLYIYYIIYMYIYIYIYIYLYVNVFKYLFLLSENKESYLYYYCIKVIRFSLDPLPRSSNLPICCCKIIV